MAARGTVSKELITRKLLETFDGAFKYDKEIRIPMAENGEEIQIKVTLTAAKSNVEHGGDVALPGEAPATQVTAPQVAVKTETAVEPSDEEKARLEQLVKTLF